MTFHLRCDVIIIEKCYKMEWKQKPNIYFIAMNSLSEIFDVENPLKIGWIHGLKNIFVQIENVVLLYWLKCVFIASVCDTMSHVLLVSK